MTAVAAEVVWSPQSRPQEALLACPVEDVFYGGARGGGKTDGLIGDFIAHAGRYGAHAKGTLFRRTLEELRDVEDRLRAIVVPLGWHYKLHEAVAPNGARLRLVYLKRTQDASNYQGWSMTWQGWDELGNWPDPRPIDLLYATLRSPHGVPCVRRSTGNPGGPGHGWVYQRYIEGKTPWVPFRWSPNPQMPHLQIESVFIPSTLDDNPLIRGLGYESRIAAAAGDDQALWQAWRYGNWDVFVGQMYRIEARHVFKTPKDELPPTTEYVATMDWGYAQAAYGLWTPTPWGGADLQWEVYTELREVSAERAARVLVDAHRRAEWPFPRTIHADEQMWQQVGHGVTLAEQFRAELVRLLGDRAPALIPAKHPPGSREVKVALIQQWLAGDVPRLRVHERCEHTRRILRTIPRDPDNPNDVDPDFAEDHLHDMVGFMPASRPRIVARPDAPDKVPDGTHPGMDYRTGQRRKRYVPWGQEGDADAAPTKGVRMPTVGVR